MPQQRTDGFINKLKQLQLTFPEYADTLQLLIDRISEGKIAKIQAALEKLRNSHW